MKRSDLLHLQLAPPLFAILLRLYLTLSDKSQIYRSQLAVQGGLGGWGPEQSTCFAARRHSLCST